MLASGSLNKSGEGRMAPSNSPQLCEDEKTGFPYVCLLPGEARDTSGQSWKSLRSSQRRGRRGWLLLRGCLCAKSCPAWQRPCPRAMLAAEVSQHSSPSLSELDRKLGAAPNSTDEVTLEIPSSNGAIPRQDPISPEEHAGLGWGTSCLENTQLPHAV